MSVKLTKRDKILLYIMAFVLVIFGFLWLAVFPQMNKSAELDASISDLETQKAPMEAAICLLYTSRNRRKAVCGRRRCSSDP